MSNKNPEYSGDGTIIAFFLAGTYGVDEADGARDGAENILAEHEADGVAEDNILAEANNTDKQVHVADNTAAVADNMVGRERVCKQDNKQAEGRKLK